MNEKKKLFLLPTLSVFEQVQLVIPTLMKRAALSGPLLCNRAPITAKKVRCNTGRGTGNSALRVNCSTAKLLATWQTTASLVRKLTRLSTPSVGKSGNSSSRNCVRHWCEKDSPCSDSSWLSLRFRRTVSFSTPSFWRFASSLLI